MKGFTRVLSLMLILTLVVLPLSLAGCKSGSNSKKPITLTVYSQRANYSGEQTGWFAKVMLDKFNVKLNIVNDADGVFVTRMESGDLGDIVILSENDYIEAIDKGLLFEWNQDDLLTEYGSYIKENMPFALEKNAGLSPDGKIYGYGFSVATSAQDHASTIYHPDARYDLYKQLGYPKISTLEDWIDVLAQMKEICPLSETGKETYGVSMFTDWDGNMVMYVKATAALYGWEELGIGLYDVENQTWQDCLAENSIYLRCLKFYNSLYQRGLVDPDSMTQGLDGENEDYTSGGAFFSLFNYLGSMQYNTPEHLAEGKAMYPIIMDDQKTLANGLNVYGGASIISIGAKSQYPELCMQIINWLSTPEGHMTSVYGPKGLIWDYDENRKTYLTDFGRSVITNQDTEMPEGYTGTYRDGANQMAWGAWNSDSSNPDSNGETYNYESWASYNATLNDPILQDWREWTGFTTFDEYINSRPTAVAVGTKFSEDKRDNEIELKWQQVSKTICDYSWRAIYASSDDEYDKIVQEMIETARGYGYEDVANFYREQAAKRKVEEDKILK